MEMPKLKKILRMYIYHLFLKKCFHTLSRSFLTYVKRSWRASWEMEARLRAQLRERWTHTAAVYSDGVCRLHPWKNNMSVLLSNAVYQLRQTAKEKKLICIPFFFCKLSEDLPHSETESLTSFIAVTAVEHLWLLIIGLCVCSTLCSVL